MKLLIRNKMAEMSKSHQKIAEFVLENKLDISFMTLSDFSTEAGVSEATIVRFCRILGFDGFSEFKENIQSDLLKATTPSIKLKDTVENILNNEDLFLNLLNIDKSMLSKAEENISEKRIQAAAKKISSGNKIYIAGIGISRSVAQFLEFRLLRMKYPVISILEGGDEVINKLLGATSDDVFIGIGFTHPRKELIAGLTIAERKSMSRIIITNSAMGYLIKKADIALYANRGPDEIMTSLSVPMTIANMLTMELALADKERSYGAYQELEKLKMEFDL